jgi:predicted AlkP superfamily phosphohydrolase/phosphomutase
MRFLQPTMLDYARTRAFSEGTFGNIILNVRGREPQGVVAPGAEYDVLRAEIRAKLEALVDPATGQRCVERTYAREELYAGARLAEAPDVVVVLAPGYQMVGDFLAVHRGGGRIPAGTLFGSGEGNRFRISGIHTPEGVLLARGAGWTPGSTLENAHITDLAPTILHQFGIDPPAEMDGRILTELVTQ